MLSVREVFVCLLCAGHGHFLFHRYEGIEVVITGDAVEKMSRQFGTAYLALAQHIAQGSQAVPVGHDEIRLLGVRRVSSQVADSQALLNYPWHQI